jgi:hypothetical protein
MIRLLLGLILFPVVFVVAYAYRILWVDIAVPLGKFVICLCTFRLISAVVHLGLWLVALVVDIPLGLLSSLGTAAKIGFGWGD